MELRDLFISPFYLVIIYLIAFKIRDQFYKDSPLKKYFMLALTVRMIGAICTGLVYYFYYGTGDTIYYFIRTKLIYDSFVTDTVDCLKLIFLGGNDNYAIPFAYLNFEAARDPASFFIVRIASVISIFSFGSYTVIALILGFFSFSGAWVLYRTFTDLYPKLHKELAIAILFIPFNAMLVPSSAGISYPLIEMPVLPGFGL